MKSLPIVDDTTLARSWEQIRDLARQEPSEAIEGLLRQEPDRARVMKLDAAGLVVDLSRQRLPLRALDGLIALARHARLEEWRDAMFSGLPVNGSESRAALHCALRDPAGELCAEAGPAVSEVVRSTLARMRLISDRVRDGSWRGCAGRPISDIIHIGIGGSKLGPQLVCDALRAFAHPRLRIHFLGNVDPEASARVLAECNPQTTLVIVASKSWRTIETSRNAQAVRAWLLDGGVKPESLERHLIAVSSNLQAATELGVSPDNILPCPDWVGGRYSLWGAVGLPVMLQIGADRFGELLAGAHAMDRHFRQAQPRENMPMLLALTSVWNAALLGSGTEAVIPYSEALARLPAHLQQLQMESNGKSVDMRGRAVPHPTMPVVWGEAGTDSQHSFFQALHQGVVGHPADFIVIGGIHDTDPWKRGLALRANALAQAQALALGHDAPHAHRRHPGNRPVTLIHMREISPATLGALIALYEHKTVCLGWLWGLNPFDQWGVELGKQIASSIESSMLEPTPAQGSSPATTFDPATKSTLTTLRRLDQA